MCYAVENGCNIQQGSSRAEEGCMTSKSDSVLRSDFVYFLHRLTAAECAIQCALTESPRLPNVQTLTTRIEVLFSVIWPHTAQNKIDPKTKT